MIRALAGVTILGLVIVAALAVDWSARRRTGNDKLRHDDDPALLWIARLMGGRAKWK
jgi:hypothetical protein